MSSLTGNEIQKFRYNIQRAGGPLVGLLACIDYLKYMHASALNHVAQNFIFDSLIFLYFFSSSFFLRKASRFENKMHLGRGIFIQLINDGKVQLGRKGLSLPNIFPRLRDLQFKLTKRISQFLLCLLRRRKNVIKTKSYFHF